MVKRWLWCRREIKIPISPQLSGGETAELVGVKVRGMQRLFRHQKEKNPLLRSLAMSVVSASLCGTMAQASRHVEPPRPEFGRFGRSWARSPKGSCRLRAREGGGWAGSERFIQTGQPGRQKDDRKLSTDSPGPLERAPRGRSNGPKESVVRFGVLELTSNVTLCPT